jgi:hypothetical protein
MHYIEMEAGRAQRGAFFQRNFHAAPREKAVAKRKIGLVSTGS